MLSSRPKARTPWPHDIWANPHPWLEATTVPILTFCGILSFVLGVLNFIYAKCSTQNRGKSFCVYFLQNSVLGSCFRLIE